MIQLSRKQRVAAALRFVECLELPKLCILNNQIPSGQQKSNFSAKEKNATIVIHSPFRNKMDIAVDGIWLLQYIGQNPDRVHDCFMAESSQDFLQVILMGSDIQAQCFLFLYLDEDSSLDQGICTSSGEPIELFLFTYITLLLLR